VNILVGVGVFAVCYPSCIQLSVLNVLAVYVRMFVCLLSGSGRLQGQYCGHILMFMIPTAPPRPLPNRRSRRRRTRNSNKLVPRQVEVWFGFPKPDLYEDEITAESRAAAQQAVAQRFSVVSHYTFGQLLRDCARRWHKQVRLYELRDDNNCVWPIFADIADELEYKAATAQSVRVLFVPVESANPWYDELVSVLPAQEEEEEERGQNVRTVGKLGAAEAVAEADASSQYEPASDIGEDFGDDYTLSLSPARQLAEEEGVSSLLLCWCALLGFSVSSLLCVLHHGSLLRE
jgi:hypothetical protein